MSERPIWLASVEIEKIWLVAPASWGTTVRNAASRMTETTEYAVVAEMIRRGVLRPEEAATHPRRNEILRSVGVEAD